MKDKIIIGLVSVLVVTITFLSVQPTQGQNNHELIVSSNDDFELVSLKPYGSENNHWSNIVKVCASSESLDIDKIVLKSDKDENVLDVNKTIEKGECSSFGSIMKGIEGKSFSAKIIERGG